MTCPFRQQKGRTAVEHEAAARKQVDVDAGHIAVFGGKRGTGAQEHHLRTARGMGCACRLLSTAYSLRVDTQELPLGSLRGGLAHHSTTAVTNSVLLYICT